MPLRLFLLPLLLLSFLAVGPLAGLQIHQLDPARHDRFIDGTFPASPAPHPALWTGAADLSGVGWSVSNPSMGLALISPRHFVGAAHHRPAIGAQIRFRATDGTLRTYTHARFYHLKNSKGENTDLFIGELAEPIPASHGIPFYPVLQTTEAALTGQEILVYGRGDGGSPRIGRGVIQGFSDSLGGAANDTRNYRFEYASRRARQDDSHGEIGDSGSPSFRIAHGLLTITGIHSAIAQGSSLLNGTTVTTYDSFILHYRDQIDAHLAPTGYRLTIAPLPGTTSLRISSFQQQDAIVTLHVENSSALPYDIEGSTDLQNWQTLAASHTGVTWTGPAPSGTEQYFWRLVLYPLPAGQ